MYRSLAALPPAAALALLATTARADNGELAHEPTAPYKTCPRTRRTIPRGRRSTVSASI